MTFGMVFSSIITGYQILYEIPCRIFIYFYTPASQDLCLKRRILFTAITREQDPAARDAIGGLELNSPDPLAGRKGPGVPAPRSFLSRAKEFQEEGIRRARKKHTSSLHSGS